MAKSRQQDGTGWHFPAPLEIIKCKEGNKEFLKERPNRKGGRLVLICEYPLTVHADGLDVGPDDPRIVWRLAKRAARDFLRNSWITSAVVTATTQAGARQTVRVYGKY